MAQKFHKEKAEILYFLPFYLRWENDKEIEKVEIAVYHPDKSFRPYLDKILENAYRDGLFYEIVEFKTIEEIRQTQILFIGQSRNYQINSILTHIKGFNTALVTENYPVQKNIMINFLTNSPEFSFEYSREKLEETRIVLIPDFDKLKGIEINSKKLFEKAEEELENEKEKVKRQKKLIAQQTAEIENQMAFIDQQKKEIENQQKEIQTRQKQIENQSKYIDDQKKILDTLMIQANRQQEELNKKNELMQQQLVELEKQTQEINRKEKEVAQKNEILRQQNQEIAERQERIDQQKMEIAQQGITIKFQQNMLLIFLVMLIIILVLTVFIFRNYKQKKKDNELLEQQKDEIEQQSAELSSVNKELEKLSIVASETASAVMILDTQGNFIWVNEGFTRMYGFTYQLLLNEMDQNIVNASNHPDIENILKETINQQKTTIYESSIQTRTGQTKWAQSTLTPIVNNFGEITQLVLIDSDITKIKEAEEKILQQNKKIIKQATELEAKNMELEKLSLVASKTDNSVIIADANGEIEWVNDGFQRMLGVDFFTFKKRFGSNFFEASLNSNIYDLVERGVYERRSIIYTEKTVKQTGQEMWIQTTLTPILNDEGELLKLVAIDADVTKIKLAEQEIAKQKEKIMDSIHYAKRIQQALLPPQETIARYVPDHFIYFNPRDVVSGDFYWTNVIGDKFMIAAADCTGHGVPGAFMSMLGISFLNEITNKYTPDQLDAGSILTQLRAQVKKSLRQEGKEGEAKDGMDIAFCIIDSDLKNMQFAGAHNPLLIIRNDQIIQYKADDMPIGIHYNEKEFFNTHHIELQPKDKLYIFSDGYPDQFGGKRGRKYMYKRFKQTLVEINRMPMQYQGTELADRFVKWRGRHRQIDDVIVIGMQV